MLWLTRLHTIRYLEPRQVLDRITRRLRTIPPPPSGAERYRLLRARPPQLRIPGRDRSFDGKSFRFLNQSVPFSGSDRWEPEGATPLWRYKLHSFQFISELDPADALKLIEDWIDQNPAPVGVGWEPYPLSMRMREWMEWMLEHPEMGEKREGQIVTSLVHQAVALESQLEFHLLANHLLENAISLCWVGLSLEGPLATRWLDRGRSILRRQLDEQVLEDGSHYERSPMYQASIVEALFRLGGIAKHCPVAEASEVRSLCEAATRRLMASLSHLLHPDGEYALVNDTVLGEAPTFEKLQKRHTASGPAGASAGFWRLPSAGYMGWRGETGEYLIFDAGDIGPDHNPGHGHADTLSFELSHRGLRLVSDTGVYTYSPGPIRDYDRSTAAHNTVEVDGRNQSELWGAFRCGRRAKVTESDSVDVDEGLELIGACRGPLGPVRKAVHRRRVSVSRGGLRFVDAVHVAGRHSGILRLHLGPGVSAAKKQSGLVIADGSGSALARVMAEGFEWQFASSPYHPEFGMEVERASLKASFAFQDLLTIRWGIELI